VILTGCSAKFTEIRAYVVFSLRSFVANSFLVAAMPHWVSCPSSRQFYVFAPMFLPFPHQMAEFIPFSARNCTMPLHTAA
jgi:hypothetical protein